MEMKKITHIMPIMMRVEQTLPLPIRQSCYQTPQGIGDFMTESLSNVRCNGVMGVPITFLDKYNPEQFEILGITLGNTVECLSTNFNQKENE